MKLDVCIEKYGVMINPNISDEIDLINTQLNIYFRTRNCKWCSTINETNKTMMISIVIQFKSRIIKCIQSLTNIGCDRIVTGCQAQKIIIHLAAQEKIGLLKLVWILIIRHQDL